MSEIESLARRAGLSVGEWARRALRQALLREPARDAESKFKAIREAVSHAFPTADIDQMLAEIGRGYRG
jgi:hypothetical protein